MGTVAPSNYGQSPHIVQPSNNEWQPQNQPVPNWQQPPIEDTSQDADKNSSTWHHPTPWNNSQPSSLETSPRNNDYYNEDSYGQFVNNNQGQMEQEAVTPIAGHDQRQQWQPDDSLNATKNVPEPYALEGSNRSLEEQEYWAMISGKVSFCS